MTSITSHHLSRRGQLSLPAETRRRWGLEDGGPVEIVDCGDSVVILPGRPGTLKRLVRDIVSPEVYRELVAAIDDPDLQTR